MSCYDILQIAPDADVGAIRTAYRRAALLAHPDKGGSEEAFRRVADAFKLISDRASRAAFLSTSRRASSHVNFSVYGATHEGDTQTGSPRGQATQSYSHGMKRRAPGVYRWPGSNTSWLFRPHRRPRDATVYRHRMAASHFKTVSILDHALERLRSVFQSMDVAQRHQRMMALDPGVRGALLDFMERRAKSRPAYSSVSGLRFASGAPQTTIQDMKQASTETAVNNRSRGSLFNRSTLSGVDGVHKFGHHFRARVCATNLEIYARTRRTLEEAVADHILLKKLQGCLATTGKPHNSFDMGKRQLRACTRILAEHQQTLGLQAKVKVRAAKWIGSVRVSSPTLPLKEALQLRARVLDARRTSWQAFRAECIATMQYKKRQGCTDADALVDTAWARAVAKRDSMAARQARALDGALTRVRRALELRQRQAVREESARRRSAVAAARRAKAASRQLRRDLWRWLRRRDLTMAEIVEGPPSQLRRPQAANSQTPPTPEM